MASKKKKKKVKRRLRKRLRNASPIVRADMKSAAWATSIARRHPWLAALAETSELTDQPPLATAAAAVAAVGAAEGDAKLLRTGKRMLAAFAAATAAKSAGKRIVARSRPSRLVDEGKYRASLLGPQGREWEAFPSGHTAGGVAMARALAREYPHLYSAGLVAAIVAGALKVFKGDHYFSDVAAGYVLGVAAESVTEAALFSGVR